ncbi:Uncharacterized protein EJ110_NYTH07707 [Nymphaea thermarum]|nr:Uncharacterized protein EJ110_NYTH07707 [Nymphaea thermarum]
MAGGLQKSAVLYHYPCPDGAFAALAAHLYFSSFGDDYPVLFFPNTVYKPLRIDDLPLGDIADVYLLDFVGPPGFVKDVSSKVQRVIILDHHKTALEMFSKDDTFSHNIIKVIDMERSGATIAFDFFIEKLHERYKGSLPPDTYLVKMFPETELSRVTQLFKYIEDADLWRWALPDSKAFSSGLRDINLEYNYRLNPNLFGQLLSLDPSDIICQGKISLLHRQKLIDEALQSSYEISLGKGLHGNCLAVNADSISNLRSELGNQLAVKSSVMKLRGIGAVVYRVPELEDGHLLKISLRSVGSEDTTVISQKYGGGGHQNASSFMLKADEFERWKVHPVAKFRPSVSKCSLLYG